MINGLRHRIALFEALLETIDPLGCSVLLGRYTKEFFEQTVKMVGAYSNRAG